MQKVFFFRSDLNKFLLQIPTDACFTINLITVEMFNDVVWQVVQEDEAHYQEI